MDEETLYDDAKKLVVAEHNASASLLQRKLKIGYAVAISLLDRMQEEGVVAPAKGARPREVLIDNPFSLPGALAGTPAIQPPVRLNKFLPPQREKLKPDATLKPVHERFCQLYFGPTPYFGKAAQAYCIAFGFDLPEQSDDESLEAFTERRRRTSILSQGGHRLLRLPQVQKRGAEVLASMHNDGFVDQELAKLITQDESPHLKLQAIKHYNEKMGRVTKKIKLSGQVAGGPLQPEDVAELDDILNKNQ